MSTPKPLRTLASPDTPEPSQQPATPAAEAPTIDPTPPQVSFGPDLPNSSPQMDDSERPTLVRLEDAAVERQANQLPAIPGYEILGELGRGGMGVVYRARHLRLNRLVALKMVLNTAYASPEARVRFLDEAAILAKLQHPNIVQVYDSGTHDGNPYFALEFVDGDNLAHLLKGEPQSPRATAELIEKLAQAMQAAHDKGIVHRDLKPANVLIADCGLRIAEGSVESAIRNPQSAIKISDFGLAKRLDLGSHMTQTGVLMGTPSYMSPEQADGRVRDIGPATDIYSLGAILYEMLTGRPPFKAVSALDTVMQVVSAEPVPPRQMQPKTDRDLETICLKCLHKEIGKRYASAAALADDLRRFLEDRPIIARPVGQWERGWRWCRRNPLVAGSLATAAVVLLAAATVSTIFGLNAEQARKDEAERAQSEAAAKRDAEQARQAAQRQLIELSAATGLRAAQDGDDALAVLWFARAIQLAKDEPEMQALNRVRFANWRREICAPVGAFLVPEFRPAEDRYRSFAFAPDGNYLLVTATRGGCSVWDLREARLAALPETARGAPAAVWAPDNLLAIAGQDGHVQFLRPPSFQPTGEEVEFRQIVTVMAFDRSGVRLAIGGNTGVWVWHRDKKEYCTPVLAHPQPLVSMTFNAAGDLLTTGARDSIVRVFRLGAEERDPLFPPIAAQTLGEFGSNLGGAELVAPRFAADDQVLLTIEWIQERNGFNIISRSAVTGQILAASGHEAMQQFPTLAVTPQGDRAADFGRGFGRVWEVKDQKLLATVPNQTQDWIRTGAFMADGRTLVTCGPGARTQIWSVDERPNNLTAVAAPPIWHPSQPVRLALAADGRHLAAAQMDGLVHIWRLPAGPPIAFVNRVGGPSLPVLSPDGRYFLARGVSYRGSTALNTRVHDVASGAVAGPVLDPEGIILDAAFSPDGGCVAIASSTGRNPAERNQRLFEPAGRSGNIQFWDWRSGQRLFAPVPAPSEPRGIAFRPGGDLLAAVCADYHVLLVDAHTGAIRYRLDPGVRSAPQNANQWWSNGEARFSPDGRFLVTWEMSPFVHVWDPDSGRLLHRLKHVDRVQHVAFSPADPALLATGGWVPDNTGRVWELTSGKLLATLPHSDTIVRMQFSPNGAELMTSCNDGQLRVWDWKNGKLQSELMIHPSFLMDFDFVRNHRWLITLNTGKLQVADWQTRLPASPLWTIKHGFDLGMAIPANGSRALVGGFAPSVIGYDLQAILTPAADAVDDVVGFSEIVAGRRILSQGSVVPLDTAEWLTRWRRLRQSPPRPKDGGENK